MDTHSLHSFSRAMEFLFAQRDHVLSEELIDAYCRQGLLHEVDGRLVVTDEGRAALRVARRRDASPSPWRQSAGLAAHVGASNALTA